MISPGSVTCVIPHYGTTKYLLESVQSAVQQNFGEIIVVNQGADASQLAPIAKLSGVRIIDMVTKYGAGPARNLGIQSCTTPYIVLLDHDDMLLEGYLENALNWLKSNNLRCVAGNLFYIGDQSKRRGIKVSKHKEFVLPSGFLMETALATEVGLFHDTLCEDLIFFHDIRKVTTIETCASALVLYRIHDQAVSTTSALTWWACTKLLPLYYSGQYSLGAINTLATEYSKSLRIPAGLESYLQGETQAKVRTLSRSAYACWLNRDIPNMFRNALGLLRHLPALQGLAMKKWGFTNNAERASLSR